MKVKWLNFLRSIPVSVAFVVKEEDKYMKARQYREDCKRFLGRLQHRSQVSRYAKKPHVSCFDASKTALEGGTFMGWRF